MLPGVLRCTELCSCTGLHLCVSGSWITYRISWYEERRWCVWYSSMASCVFFDLCLAAACMDL